MASNKRKTKEEVTKAPATAGAPEAATTAPEAIAPTITREEARLRIACALIQCPRFAHQVQVPSGQDYLVKVTDELTAKLGY